MQNVENIWDMISWEKVVQLHWVASISTICGRASQRLNKSLCMIKTTIHIVKLKGTVTKNKWCTKNIRLPRHRIQFHANSLRCTVDFEMLHIKNPRLRTRHSHERKLFTPDTRSIQNELCHQIERLSLASFRCKDFLVRWRCNGASTWQKARGGSPSLGSHRISPVPLLHWFVL